MFGFIGGNAHTRDSLRELCTGFYPVIDHMKDLGSNFESGPDREAACKHGLNIIYDDMRSIIESNNCGKLSKILLSISYASCMFPESWEEIKSDYFQTCLQMSDAYLPVE